jgi:hypothetical protein
MSVQWWEIWSPGLQAFGGGVELIGIAALYLEWRQNQRDETNRRMSRKYGSNPIWISNFASRGQAGGDEDLVAEAVMKADRERREVEALDDVLAEESQTERAKTYLVGVLITIGGVLFQIIANVIGWSGALGWFSP